MVPDISYRIVGDLRSSLVTESGFGLVLFFRGRVEDGGCYGADNQAYEQKKDKACDCFHGEVS